MHKALTVKLATPGFANGKSMLIAGLRERYRPETLNDIPAQWQRMAFHFGSIPGRVGRVNYGVVFNMANCRDGFDYLSGFEVSSLSGLPSDFSHETIPAQGYVVFSHREHVSKLKETVNAIWQEWLPASGSVVAHTIPDAPDMIEYYGENFDPQTGTGDIEIWIPVRE